MIINEDDRCSLDAQVLRQAAKVIRRRTTRPKSFWVRVITRVLELNASRLEREHGGLR